VPFLDRARPVAKAGRPEGIDSFPSADGRESQLIVFGSSLEDRHRLILVLDAIEGEALTRFMLRIDHSARRIDKR
jgi:hypothetical protein